VRKSGASTGPIDQQLESRCGHADPRALSAKEECTSRLRVTQCIGRVVTVQNGAAEDPRHDANLADRAGLVQR
jgi:hypothetical protein